MSSLEVGIGGGGRAALLALEDIMNGGARGFSGDSEPQGPVFVDGVDDAIAEADGGWLG